MHDLEDLKEEFLKCYFLWAEKKRPYSEKSLDQITNMSYWRSQQSDLLGNFRLAEWNAYVEARDHYLSSLRKWMH